MPSPSVLLVEDDYKTADTVALYLRHDGFRVVVAHDGLEGLSRATTESFDVVILDRMLPGIDGVSICERIRSEADTPVILLTAMVGERDRLDGFEVGADDYVVKPFSPRELVARVRALLRRAEAQGERKRGVVRIGDLVLDIAGDEASRAGRALGLSPTEFRILHALAASPGRIFSRDELMERALESADRVDTRVIDAHVKNLRRKLDPSRSEPSMIRTAFGRGYKLVRSSERG